MTFRALLGKEFRWGRRRVVALLLLLVLLPGLFAYTSLLFQTVLPKTAPVAVVADSEDVTEKDVELATRSLRLFAEPVHYDSREAAFNALSREQVYGVLVVPPELDAQQGDATVEFHVDARVVPYREPSQAIDAALGRTFGRGLAADVTVDWVPHHNDPPLPLSAYLLPTFLYILLAVLAFVYLPYNLAAEADALDRVRVQSSLAAYLAAKLAFFTVLGAVPLVVFAGVAALLSFPVELLASTAVAGYLLSFVGFAGVASAVTFLTRFETTGRLLNVVLLFVVLAFSGLVYPAGFFSPTRRELIRLIPTHYGMVLVRNAALKDLGAATYPTAALVVAGFAVGGLAMAGGSLVHYRRVAE